MTIYLISGGFIVYGTRAITTIYREREVITAEHSSKEEDDRYNLIISASSILTELYEESQAKLQESIDELGIMKQYLNEVLEEVKELKKN